MKYELKDFNRYISDNELLDDLKRIADNLGTSQLSSRDYKSNGGRYASVTIGVRFGSWNKALEKAGLNLVMKMNPSEKELFKNIEEVWIKLGRQPVIRDMKRPLSNFSADPYRTKFGTFRNALIAFIEYVNSNNEQEKENTETEANYTEPTPEPEFIFKHKTKRFPSERLKVQVLMRDGNKCSLCGIIVIGDNIHFDHVKPWSKGGETILENLQVLCSKHNLAKGNLEYDEK